MELATSERRLFEGTEEHAVTLAAKDATVAANLAAAREDAERVLVTVW